MTLSSHHAELQKMIKGFRVSDLQTLLIYGGKNKAGKKSELQARALDLIRQQGPNMTSVEMKIRELHRNRYAQTHGHAEPPEIYPPDMYSSGFNDPVGNPYPVGSHKAPMGAGVLPSNFMQSYSHQMRSNPAMSLLPQYPVNPDVQFKDLPFYDVLSELLKPTSLVPVRNDGIIQEKEIMFYLGPQDIRELENNNDCQVQFRIGCLESNQEQDDEFPSSVCIKVNTKVAPLPNPIPTNKPGVEAKRPKRPLDITSMIKLSSSEPQILCVSWAATNNFKPYVTAVYLVRKQTSSVLIKRLKDIGVRNPDHTTAMIKEKLNLDRDSEIATMSLRGSLMCPLGKIKMTLPCRALTCTHLQCFDAALYIQMNEKKPKWICPVCDKPAVFKSLAIDGLFLDITRKVPSECTEVQFHENGSWTPVMPVKKAPEIKEIVPLPKVEAPKPKKQVEIVNLDSDSDTEDSWPIPPPKKKPCKPVGVINPVVLDSSETSITIEPTVKSYDVLQPCSSKSILSTSKVSALPAEKNSSHNTTSNFPLFFSSSSSSKDFESTAFSPTSPTNQSSASSTFQEPVDVLNNPSSTAGQCYDFDLYSLMQPTENLQETFQFQDAPTEETIVNDDTPDIISID